MKFSLLVAIEAGHPLLIMNIGCTTVLSREFRVNPASVAYGTGLSVIPGDELVILDKTRTDSAHLRGFHVTIAARGVTAPAGLLKYLFVEYPLFFL